MSGRSLSMFMVVTLVAVSSLFAAHPNVSAEALGKLPITFEANQGEFDAAVHFVSRTPRYTMFLTAGETVLALRGANKERDVVRWRLAGANHDPRIAGEGPLQTHTN